MCGQPGHRAPKCPQNLAKLESTDPIDEAAQLRMRYDALQIELDEYLRVKKKVDQRIASILEDRAKTYDLLQAARARR